MIFCLGRKSSCTATSQDNQRFLPSRGSAGVCSNQTDFGVRISVVSVLVRTNWTQESIVLALISVTASTLPCIARIEEVQKSSHLAWHSASAVVWAASMAFFIRSEPV